MDIAVGDTILTRKKHPCGASSFEVLRVGMDIKLRCMGCGHEVMCVDEEISIGDFVLTSDALAVAAA